MLPISLIVSIGVGFAAIRVCLPEVRRRPGWTVFLLMASLSAGLGVAITSLTYFLLLLSASYGRVPVIAAEALLCAGLIVIATRRRAVAADGPRPVPATTLVWWNRFLALALCVEAALVAAAFFESSSANPFGGWDAFGIWNLRARFLAGDGESWRNAVSPLLVHTHPDYPLLLSGFIARCWKWTGAVSQAAPISAAFLFLFATAGLMVSTISLCRGASAGLLAGLVLLASPPFASQAAMQYADIPLAFYMLASLSLLVLAGAGGIPGRTAVALAGACASLAAWTKNEGLLFIGVLSAAYLAVEGFGGGWRRALKLELLFLLGAAPVLLLTLYFKHSIAPAADTLVTQPLSDAMARLSEADRFARIARAFWTEARLFGVGWYHPGVAVVILAAALRFRLSPPERRWAALAGLTLAGVLAGYFGIYLVTPADLEWHLSTSLGRLLVQVWPSALLLAFVVFRPIEDGARQTNRRETNLPMRFKTKKRRDLTGG